MSTSTASMSITAIAPLQAGAVRAGAAGFAEHPALGAGELREVLEHVAGRTVPPKPDRRSFT